MDIDSVDRISGFCETLESAQIIELDQKPELRSDSFGQHQPVSEPGLDLAARL